MTARVRLVFGALTTFGLLTNGFGRIALGQVTDEQLIRQARAASNAAIARHDAEAVAGFLLENAQAVFSTSAILSGRAANQASYASRFQQTQDVRWVRTPSTVKVWNAWQVAAEEGEWTGEWTQTDGKVHIRGSYFAQWRKIDGTWRIQAEVFVPLECSGSSYCAARPAP